MPPLTWTAWFIIGLCLLIAEMLTPTFFLVFFGLAAFVVASLEAMGALTSANQQWLCFVFLGSMLAVTLRQLLQRKVTPEDEPAVDGLIGEVGVALAMFDKSGRGQVELRGSVWSASVQAGTAQMVEQGARLRVIHVEGLSLIVEKV